MYIYDYALDECALRDGLSGPYLQVISPHLCPVANYAPLDALSALPSPAGRFLVEKGSVRAHAIRVENESSGKYVLTIRF